MARTSKFSPEVRERAVRMVLDHAEQHASAHPSFSAREGTGWYFLHGRYDDREA